MYNSLKGAVKTVFRMAAGDRAFRMATMSALVFLTGFFVVLVFGMAAYTDLETVISTVVSKEVLFALRLSIITASAAAFLAMIVAVPVAYALSCSDFPGKSFVDTVLDLPIVISPVAIGAALLVFFNTPAGRFIESRFTGFVFEVPGIVLAQFVVVSALAVRLLKSTFDGIDPRFEQVGRTLGCSKLTAFFRVTLPLAKNGIISSAVLTWARAVGEFGATVTLAGATTFKTETLPVALFLSLSTVDVEKAVAVVFILVGVAVAALLMIRKLGGKGYTV